MADNNDEGHENELALWGAVGGLVGFVLAAKVLSAMGAWGNPLSVVECLILAVLVLAPLIGLVTIARHLHADVVAGKSTKATYWTAMIGISVTALALAGITSIDDIIAMAK
ncbi:hypothetical protein ACH4NR_32330 [Streptomyces globisporus]|uniref:hypothetical protein n=1 Tax=Streptomyces globisporus TaxID=1908 RepID=UPI00345F7DD4|nr:hypothetical protein OG838_35930 [Streptomyces globisporus]